MKPLPSATLCSLCHTSAGHGGLNGSRSSGQQVTIGGVAQQPVSAMLPTGQRLEGGVVQQGTSKCHQGLFLKVEKPLYPYLHVSQNLDLCQDCPLKTKCKCLSVCRTCLQGITETLSPGQLCLEVRAGQHCIHCLNVQVGFRAHVSLGVLNLVKRVLSQKSEEKAANIQISGILKLECLDASTGEDVIQAVGILKYQIFPDWKFSGA